jgi:hypothetical protein
VPTEVSEKDRSKLIIFARELGQLNDHYDFIASIKHPTESGMAWHVYVHSMENLVFFYSQCGVCKPFPHSSVFSPCSEM